MVFDGYDTNASRLALVSDALPLAAQLRRQPRLESLKLETISPRNPHIMLLTPLQFSPNAPCLSITFVKYGVYQHVNA